VPLKEPALSSREVGTLLGRVAATLRSQVAIQLARHH
jgi:hypothetical protein